MTAGSFSDANVLGFTSAAVGLVTFVRTGDRTPFAYLMKPITDSMSLAWREQ